MAEIKPDISSKVMDRITRDGVKMRPEWYFVAGSLLMVVGMLAAFGTGAFAVAVIMFGFKHPGALGQMAVGSLWGRIPLWAPVVGILGVWWGVELLKRYDFAYKKDVRVWIAILAILILGGGYLMERLRLPERIVRSEVRQLILERQMLRQERGRVR